MAPSANEITSVLADLQEGRATGSELFERLYGPLRAIARRALDREKRPCTLRPTELVHDAYLALVVSSDIDWRGTAHFRAVAARCFRHLLVDHSRRRQAERRGGGRARVTLREECLADDQPLDTISLDDALEALGQVSKVGARIVELRYFGGMSDREIAHVLEVSERTVRREWQTARAWLRRRLDQGEDPV